MPVAIVAQIRKGRGPKDAAGDCVALAKLFRAHADAARGVVDVPDADVAAADAIGTKLLAALLPASARKAPDKALVAAMTARDRLSTLLERTWEQNVWLAGAVLFGRAVESHVPLLGSRVVGKRAAPVPAPVPVPVAS